MPRIPQYQQQSTPNATLNPRTLDTGGQDIVRGLASIGQGAERMGRSIKYVQEVDQRKAEADDMASVHLAATKFQADWTTTLAERMTNAEADPTGFTEGVLKDYDTGATELAGLAKTPRGKQYVAAEIMQMRASIAARSIPWEAEKGIQRRAGQYQQTIDQQRIAARADPTLYDRILEQQGVALNGLSLPVDVRDKLWSETRESVAASAVETLIDRNPSQTLKALRSAPGKSGSTAIEGLTPEARERALRGAEAEMRRREAEARARAAEARQGLAEAEADAFAFKAAGMPAQLPSRGAYLAAYGADEGAKRYGQKSQIMGVYDVVGAAVLMPPEQGQAEILAYKPATQAGAADQAQVMQAAAGLYAQQRKAFEADPAGALIGRDPELRRMLEAATQPGASPEAVNAYSLRVRSAQQAAGIAAPVILPAGMADQVAGQLSFDPKHPERRAQQLQALQQQWGKQFPQVLREVAPKLDGTARVMVGMKPEKAARLDAALQAGEATSKAVPKADANVVTETLRSELQPFAATLVDNVDFEARYGEHFAAAETLALSYVARGESPRNAAKLAAAAVVGDSYEFQGSVRIPKNVAPAPVLAGADAAKRAALDEPLAIQSSTWSNDEQAQADLKAAISGGGYWVTNEDQTGLILMVPTKRGASAVYDAKGRRYERDWADLSALGTRTQGGVPGYINPQSPTAEYLFQQGQQR